MYSLSSCYHPRKSYLDYSRPCVLTFVLLVSKKKKKCLTDRGPYVIETFISCVRHMRYHLIMEKLHLLKQKDQLNLTVFFSIQNFLFHFLCVPLYSLLAMLCYVFFFFNFFFYYNYLIRKVNQIYNKF